MEGLDCIDARRIAVTVTHFPESRTLAADEADEESVHSCGPLPPTDRTGALGYDPAFLLPFCVKVIAHQPITIFLLLYNNPALT